MKKVGEDLKNVMEKDTITSLELVDQINFFRKEEGKKTETQHKTLLEIIRNEFEGRNQRAENIARYL